MAIKSVHHVDDTFAGGGMSFGPTPLASYGGLQQKAGSFLEPGREAQLGALAQMKEAAAGRGGPSAAQTMLRENADRAALMGMNQAAMTRGGNLAGATQSAMGLSAGLGAQAGQQAATLRAQEQAAAQQQYAAMATQLAQQGMGYDELAQNTLLQGTGLEQDWRLGNRGMDIQEDQYNRNRWLEFAKMGMQGLGSALGAMSDERAKNNTQGSDLAASEAVGAIPSVKYEYKPGYGGPGERVGQIAQDVERVRPELVMETPYGKALDVGGIASLSLAASSEQEQRIRQLEAALGGRQSPGALAALDAQPRSGAPGGRVMSSVPSGPPTGQRDTVATLGGGSRPSIEAQLAAEAARARSEQPAIERMFAADPFADGGTSYGPYDVGPMRERSALAMLSDEGVKTIDPFGGDDMKAQRMEAAGSALSGIGRSLSAAGGAEPGPDGMGTILGNLAEKRRQRLGGLGMMSDVRAKRVAGY